LPSVQDSDSDDFIEDDMESYEEQPKMKKKNKKKEYKETKESGSKE
jgi:hypothetical protein